VDGKLVQSGEIFKLMERLQAIQENEKESRKEWTLNILSFTRKIIATIKISSFENRITIR